MATIKPKLFKPSKKEVMNVLEKVSELISPDKEISSSNYPTLKVRGTYMKTKTN